jgi:hypothetical protein
MGTTYLILAILGAIAWCYFSWNLLNFLVGLRGTLPTYLCVLEGTQQQRNRVMP